MKRSPVILAAGVCLLTAGLASGQNGPDARDARDALYNQGPKQEAVGESVMVSTQLPIVTETALEVLRNGGNAIDAFVTAVFLQNVVDYHQVSLFGAMGGLYYEASSGNYYVFESYSERPLAGRCGEGDPSQVAIGGKVAGLGALADRFGTKEWTEYLEPAITAAEEGVLVTISANIDVILHASVLRSRFRREAGCKRTGNCCVRCYRGTGVSWRRRKGPCKGRGGSVRSRTCCAFY